jgi:hypothetical protein
MARALVVFLCGLSTASILQKFYTGIEIENMPELTKWLSTVAYWYIFVVATGAISIIVLTIIEMFFAKIEGDSNERRNL